MALKFVLLTLLDRQPQSGYEIVKAFDDAVGFFWTATHQQVYRELAGLTDKKLVKFVQIQQSGNPDKKVYSTTASGKRELREWIETPLKETPVKNQLLVKLLNLSEQNTDTLLSEIDVVIKRCKETQKIYQGIERTSFPHKIRTQLSLQELPLYLALRQGLIGLESYLKWLGEAKSEIRKRKANY